MLRIVLAVIAGFIAWSVIWVGAEQLLSQASPEWFGAHQTRFERAVFNGEAFTPDATILIFNLARAAVVSIMAGFLAAVIAGENRRAPSILGVALLAFGIYIAASTWGLVPIWYITIMVLLLMPMTILGGRMKTRA